MPCGTLGCPKAPRLHARVEVKGLAKPGWKVELVVTAAMDKALLA